MMATVWWTAGQIVSGIARKEQSLAGFGHQMARTIHFPDDAIRILKSEVNMATCMWEREGQEI